MSTERHTRPSPRRDPVLVALRRLIAETDRTIAAADKARQARVELAKLLENAVSGEEGGHED